MKESFGSYLTSWYRNDHRDLPFRRTHDPYCIWISEIMAQQTRIDQMLPYYERWLAKWPSIQALAQAPLEEVLHAWEGLGYYNRARKLHETACLLVDQYQGQFPSTYETIRALPGIGDYTAGAIGSIAFGLATPAVDGNVMRVLSRVYEISDDVAKASTKRKLTLLCTQLMEHQDPSDFTQGLMECGALVCTPKNPNCSICPLAPLCQANQHQTTAQYPYKAPKKAPKELSLYVYLCVHHHQILLSKDDSDGLMKGLLRLPQSPHLYPSQSLGFLKHTFSHRIWAMHVQSIEKKDLPLSDTFWVSLDELPQLTLVTAHRKVLAKYLASVC